MDKVSNREMIEWTNTWREYANQNKMRILLIGDSVTRGIRSSLQSVVGGQYSVDLFATSAAITDISFKRDVEFFLSYDEWQYSIIVFQCGLHHGLNMRCCQDALYESKWEQEFAQLVKMTEAHCEDIIFLSGTPEVYASQTTKLNEKINIEIRKRNQIIKRIADKWEKKYIDVYSSTIGVGYVDAQHFMKKGYDIIAKVLEKQIEDSISESWEKIIAKSLNTIFYGIGFDGAHIYSHLSQESRERLIVCDRKAEAGEFEWHHKRVYSPDAVLTNNTDLPIIITSDKYGEEIKQELLKKYGKAVEGRIYRNRIPYYRENLKFSNK